jgi:acyl-coenzyme A thioesterase PaaI-like protein
VANQTDFIRATTEGVLIGSATPIHRGRTQQLWQVSVTNESTGKLVARGQVRLQNVTSTDFEPRT